MKVLRMHSRPQTVSVRPREQLTQSLCRQNQLLRTIKQVQKGSDSSRPESVQNRNPTKVTLYRQFFSNQTRKRGHSSISSNNQTKIKVVHNAMPSSFGKKSLLSDMRQFASYVKKGIKILSARGKREQAFRLFGLRQADN